MELVEAAVVAAVGPEPGRVDYTNRMEWAIADNFRVVAYGEVDVASTSYEVKVMDLGLDLDPGAVRSSDQGSAEIAADLAETSGSPSQVVIEQGTRRVWR